MGKKARQHVEWYPLHHTRAVDRECLHSFVALALCGIAFHGVQLLPLCVAPLTRRSPPNERTHMLSSADAVRLYLTRRPRSPTHPRSLYRLLTSCFADRSLPARILIHPPSMPHWCCRCTRKSEVNYMDQNTRIYRFCRQHKEPAVVLEQAARCKVIDFLG